MRRVKAKLSADRKDALLPNDVWVMDFVHDQLATGRKIRILTVVDIFSRCVPVLDARFSYKGEDVVTTLDRICRQIGYPKTIRVGNGSEFNPTTWIFGLTNETSPSISLDLENRLITPTSRPSMVSSGPNA